MLSLNEVCLDGMEGVEDKVAASDITGNTEVRRKEIYLPLKPEGHIMMESPIMHEAMGRRLPESLPHKDIDTTEYNDLSRCVISLGGSQQRCTSSCSLDDPGTGIAVEESTARNYGTPRLALVSRTNSSRQGRMKYLYHLDGGSRCKISDGDSLPQDLDRILLRVREQLARTSPDKQNQNLPSSRQSEQTPGRISAYFRATEKEHVSGGALPVASAQFKTLSTSSFCPFSIKRTLKGKAVVSRDLEAPTQLGGGIAAHDDEKRDNMTKVTSNALLKSSVDNDMHLSHSGRVDESSTKSSRDGISLREWLGLGGHRKDKVGSLFLFRQIVEVVEFAHSQGFALKDLRPSCFYLLSNDRVLYSGSWAKDLESAIDLNLSRKRPLEEDSHVNFRDAKQQTIDQGMQSANKTDKEDSGHFQSRTSVMTRHRSFSESVQLEEKWYASPQEQYGRGCTFSSNIYRLGVLLFELLCCCESREVHCTTMSHLRYRVLPPSFLADNPKEAGFCLWLLHPDPLCRPTSREILRSELMRDVQELRSEDNVLKLTAREDAEADLLLHFLLKLKEQEEKHASKLVEDIAKLEEDIKEVERRYFLSTASVFSHAADRKKGQLHLEEPGISHALSRSPFVQSMNKERLMKHISQLEDAYFSMRSQIHPREIASTSRCDKGLLKSRDSWSKAQNENEEARADEKNVDSLGAFFDDLCKFARYSKIESCGTLRIGDLMNSANVICSLSFNRDEEYIAAAGVSKKIKIFEFDAFMNDSIDVHYPVVEMSNKSKFSCVCWNNYIKNYLASADYDGTVQLWDAGTGQAFSQHREHEKRAWSVDFSLADPRKFASGSDDCSVKLWSLNEESSIGTIWNPANVCCVQFSSSSSHMLAFGTADYKIYCYDLRQAAVPWCILVGHGKAVSYVKFLDSATIVSASTDSTLKLWDLNKMSSTGLSSNACTLTFRGHRNEKNFVGLSVLDGYIACGSETNEVYSYYKSLPMPICSYKFVSVDPISGQEIDFDNGEFVSSVCWRPKSNMLVAANSSGNMKLLQLI